MPEEIPAVEDIKFARKRLEELAVENEEKTPHTLAEQLAKKFQEKTDLPNATPKAQTTNQIWEYKLPESVTVLEQLTKIIKGYP